VVGLGVLDARDRQVDAAVVDEPQVVVAVLREQPVGLERVDVAAEQVADVAVAVPGVVVLEPAFVVLEQEPGRARLLDLVEDRLAVLRDQRAGQPVQLAIEHDARSRLERVRADAHDPCVVEQRRLAAAGVEHHLDAGPVAGFQRADPEEGERSVAAVQQGSSRTEQRAVEIQIDAAHEPPSMPVRGDRSRHRALG
jgi:hypothetical protein